MRLGSEEDTAFAPGDVTYGCVDVDPVQSLGNDFRLDIEKVFLCSGQDGYIPKYDPEAGEYGCVVESKNLNRVFRIVTDTGQQWFLHTIYNIRSSQRSQSNRGKRSQQTFHLVKRAVADVQGKGTWGR